MHDKQELRERTERGIQAQSLMEHPLFKEALALLTQSVLNEFAATKPKDTATLQLCRIKLQVANDFKEVFRIFAYDGANATAELKQIDKIDAVQRVNRG